MTQISPQSAHHLNVGSVRPWEIDDWIRAGKPIDLPARLAAGMRAGCRCNPVKELAVARTDLAQWLQICPGCQAQVAATTGRPYVPGTGFAAPGTQVPSLFQPITAAAEAPMARPGFMPGADDTVIPTRRQTVSIAQAGDPKGSGVSIPQIHPTEGGGTTVSTRTRMVGVLPPAADPFSLGGAIVGGITGFGTGGPLGGLVGGLLGGFGGEGESTTSPGTRGSGLGLGGGCPSGFEWRNGRCEQVGIVGAMERFFPGGQTGTLADVSGQAQMGMFGVPAVAPAAMAQPVLRCPRGTVLGKDNLCYAKGSISNRQRKWPRAPRPVMSAMDAKTLRRAETLKNKAKKVATAAGFSCRKR